MTFHKPVGEANPHIQFGYGPLKICKHTRGQVSGSMNDGTINSNVQPLRSLFRSELVNNWLILCTHNRHSRHNLPQAWGASKYVCPVWIRPTDNLLLQLSTSIMINKRWSDQCQSTTTQKHTNNSKLGYWTRNHTLSLMGYWELRLGPVISNIANFFPY